MSPHYCWGVYLDDNTGGVDVIGNIVARCVRGLVHLHNGRDNVIENNILIDGKLQQVEYNGWTASSRPWHDHLPTMIKGYDSVAGQPAWKQMRHMDIRPQDAVLPNGMIMANNVFRRNIIYFHDPNAKVYQMRTVPFDHNECDDNLIWHFGQPLLIGLPNTSPEQQWAEWQKLGNDRHSVIADPLFVNPDKDDYHLRPNSPAFKLGFQPIPIDKIGPYKDELRASWPIVEAEGAREHPLVSEAPVETAAASRKIEPVTVPKIAAPVGADGIPAPGEWPGAKLTLADTPDRTPIAGTPCTARVCHDDRCLYLVVTVPIPAGDSLTRTDEWGRADGTEVCFQDRSGVKYGSAFVLHGFTTGHHQSATDGGAPADAAAKLGAAVRYTAKVSNHEWTAEWAIPFAAAGITPRPGTKLAFNLGVRRQATDEWIVWVGAYGATWQLDNGGVIVLQ